MIADAISISKTFCSLYLELSQSSKNVNQGKLHTKRVVLRFLSKSWLSVCEIFVKIRCRVVDKKFSEDGNVGQMDDGWLKKVNAREKNTLRFRCVKIIS